MKEATKPNVILTGFMGTGKSTVGRLLAGRLGYEWVDTDTLIEDRYGPIPNIFATSGEAGFRDHERTVTSEVARRGGLVISTGGRLMLDPGNADVLGATGPVYCLTARAETIAARTAEDRNDRPLLPGEDRLARIDALLEERAAGYASFEQISTDGRTPEAVVEEIMDRLHGRLPG